MGRDRDSWLASAYLVSERYTVAVRRAMIGLMRCPCMASMRSVIAPAAAAEAEVEQCKQEERRTCCSRSSCSSCPIRPRSVCLWTVHAAHGIIAPVIHSDCFDLPEYRLPALERLNFGTGASSQWPVDTIRGNSVRSIVPCSRACVTVAGVVLCSSTNTRSCLCKLDVVVVGARRPATEKWIRKIPAPRWLG